MRKDPFLAYYEGRDSGAGDTNPYPKGSACWHGWRHGHAAEWGKPGRPMTSDEVKAAFAVLNKGGA